MCGIIGYIGKRNNPRIGLEALKRLEYRGYDSAGMAFYDSKRGMVRTIKAVGRVSELEKKMNKARLSGSPFIFHTRWATHGAPTAKNAHPHTDSSKSVFVVHNGIIENHQQLKDWLSKRGVQFISQTDTEVLAQLIGYYFKGDLQAAVSAALKRVKGTYGIAVISAHSPNELIAARPGRPPLIGVGDNEYFIASDAAGVLAHTKRVVYLEDNELAKLTPQGFEIINKDYPSKVPQIEEIEWDIEEAQKGGYGHFMLKEIMEQPESIKNTIRGRTLKREGTAKLGGLELVRDKLADIKKIHIVACGTAYYAGLIGKYMLEEYAGVPTEVELGSEFRYRKPLLDPNHGAVLCISQSGETADTIAPLQEAKQKGVLTLGIVNVVGSTIARETDAGIYNHAGPEIGVASTKAFSSQLTALALLTIFLGRQRGMSFTMGRRIGQEIERLPKYVEFILKKDADIKRIARKYKNSPNMLFLGRKYNYPIALEGALKLKEISYLHAEGYAGGETKHGPIAMIDSHFPTLAIMPRDSVYEKMVSNVEELRARGGPIIAVTTQGNRAIHSLTNDVMYIPKTLEMLTPILSVVPLQLFAYHVGVSKGYNVDKPRTLAKRATAA